MDDSLTASRLDDYRKNISIVECCGKTGDLFDLLFECNVGLVFEQHQYK